MAQPCDSINTTIAIQKVRIYADDAGAPVPLDLSACQARILELLAENPPNYTLLGEYYVLAGYLAMAQANNCPVP